MYAAGSENHRFVVFLQLGQELFGLLVSQIMVRRFSITFATGFPHIGEADHAVFSDTDWLIEEG